MIDLHSHILPQMDDGSGSPEESLALWEAFQAQGVTTLAATSHFYPDRESPEEFLARREKSLALLPDCLRSRLILGAEVAYFPGIGSCQSVVPLQLENTRLLLVEMPFCNWNDRMVEDICAIPLQLGLTPVLAHVNRYRGKSQFPKYYRQLLESDVLFQCNAEAFVPGLSGRWAMQQLKKGVLEMLVLELVCQGSTYGYELLTRLKNESNGLFTLKEGTLYPILYRLEDDGMICSNWSTGEGRTAPKKMYSATEAGRAYRLRQRELWKNFTETVNGFGEEL